MRHFSTKSKNTHNILGILGILLLVWGGVSLIFQYSTIVEVYAQTVNVGPPIKITPPPNSRIQDSDSDGQDIFMGYIDQAVNNGFLAKVAPGPGGRSETLVGTPVNIAPGASDVVIDVNPAGDISAAVVQNGEIGEVDCEDSPQACTDPTVISTPEQIETSCFDGVDNDVDGEADSDDSDCFPCYDSGEGGPDVAAFGGMGARLQFVTAIPDPEQLCPFEAGDLCDDGIDNDGDGAADQEEDPDCGLEGGYAFFDINCNDGLDNDGDELTDAADPGCNEAGEETCSNGDDDDGDGAIDGDDPGCAVEPPVGIEGEGGVGEDGLSSCSDDHDNDGDGATDIADDDCKWSSNDESAPRGLCSDTLDNDGDDFTDSEDEDCFQPQIGLQGGDDEIADAEDNDTAGVEPTSFNLQTGATSPQLTFVQTGGGGTPPPASNPDVAISDDDGSDRYVVWEQGGDIMFTASHDSGASYGEILNLSNNAGTSKNPSVATSADGEFVHVTWEDNTPGNYEIFYSRSTDGGDTFNNGSPVGAPTNLSNTPRESNDHQLLTEGSNVYVVWVDYTTGNGDIYFRESNDNGGDSFGSTINLSRGSRLSFLSSRDPDMAAHENLVGVTWSVRIGSTTLGEIVFRESATNGNSFGSHVIVSRTPLTDSKEPQVDYTPEDAERYFAFLDKGLRRVHIAQGTYAVVAVESDNGRTMSAPVVLSDYRNNPDRTRNAEQVEVLLDVATWDPTSRRG